MSKYSPGRTYFNRKLREIERQLCDVEVTPEDYAELEAIRPKTFGDCANVPRPCPFLFCRYNLVFDRADFDNEDETLFSCALEAAEEMDQQVYSPYKGQGGEADLSLNTIGRNLAISREFARQLILRIPRKLRKKAAVRQLGQESTEELCGRSLTSWEEIENEGWFWHTP